MSSRRRKRRSLPRRLLGLSVFCVSILLISSAGVSRGGAVNFNAGLNRAVGTPGEKSDQLVVGSTKLCDSFDPALSFDNWCGVVMRMFARNVVAFAGKPGNRSLDIVPDLAMDMPIVSSDFTSWTYTLRDDVLWDDGSPVTTDDVRYSIERLFDPDYLGVVSQDTMCLLSTCSALIPDYEGPRAGKNLKSIDTPDARTITFTLTRPYALWNNILALPQFAPIQKAKESALNNAGREYSSEPASNGPFILTVADDEKSAEFVPNPTWRQSIDGVRVPQVNSMKWMIFENSDELDAALLRGEVDVRLDRGLGAPARERILLDTSLKKFTDQPATGSVNYLSLIPTSIPLDRLACRQAIAYALDKTELSQIRGGSDVALRTGSMVSPVLPGGGSTADMYPVGADGTGDLNAARNKLIECGYPDGFEIKMAYVTLGVGQATFESVQRSLSRIGIVVDPVKFDSFAQYFSTGVGTPASVETNGIGMIGTSWSPEAISPLLYWGPIADGRKIKQRGNINYSQYLDEQVNALLDSIETGNPDPGRISKAIGNLVMKSAYFVPYSTERMVLYRGSYLTNVYVHKALAGQYDVVNIGVNR